MSGNVGLAFRAEGGSDHAQQEVDHTEEDGANLVVEIQALCFGQGHRSESQLQIGEDLLFPEEEGQLVNAHHQIQELHDLALRSKLR